MTKSFIGVDFNSLRRSAMNSCDALVRALNSAHADGMDVQNVDGLEEAVQRLRQSLACIGMVFVKDDESFQDVCGDRTMLQLSWVEDDIVEEDEEDSEQEVAIRDENQTTLL